MAGGEVGAGCAAAHAAAERGEEREVGREIGRILGYDWSIIELISVLVAFYWIFIYYVSFGFGVYRQFYLVFNAVSGLFWSVSIGSFLV